MCYNETIMTFLTHLAHTYYYTTYPTQTVTPADSAAAAALGFGFFVFFMLLFAAIYVVYAIFLGRIFKKAGQPAWIAWVPFYNDWKLLELGGQQGFWAVLAIVPIVNYVSLVFKYIAMYHVGKKLGKEGAFVLLAIFLPIVWLIWLGVDKSKWNDKGSSAPSLAK
jgi:hypothetical protein